MYTTLDIAHYIVDYAQRVDKGITNLQLNRVLYALWILYYKKTGEYLFENNFHAWKTGPIDPDVFHKYSIYMHYIIKPAGVVMFDRFSFLDDDLDYILSEDNLQAYFNREDGASRSTIAKFGIKHSIPTEYIINFEI